MQPDLYVGELNNTLPYTLQRLGLSDTGTYTVYLEPLIGVADVSAPQTFSDLDLLETVIGALTYTLETEMAQGDLISFNVVVDNGAGLLLRELVTQYYGSLTTTYTNAVNDLGDWQTTSWDISTDAYYSAPGSLTNSPFGEYENETFSEVLLTDTLDLENASLALLTFWAKWDIENDFDFVQLSAYDVDEGIFTPLCGQYTNLGSGDQLPGQPIYDGVQQDWVQENILLNDFVGHRIQLHLLLQSDPFVQGDGFYIDDIALQTLSNNVGIAQPTVGSLLTLQPNPAGGMVRVSYGKVTEGGTLKVVNALGQTVHSQTLPAGSSTFSMDVSAWAVGFTFCLCKPKWVGRWCSNWWCSSRCCLFNFL